MEEDIVNLTTQDLHLLHETFAIIRNNSEYRGSEVQLGFRQVFSDADKDNDGFVERNEFAILIDGYLGSKHIKPTQADYDEYFKKIDLNNDGKISFDDCDIFIRIVYETEYIPALEKEIARRRTRGEGGGDSHNNTKGQLHVHFQ